jgi:predicted nucleotide-binding protein
MSGQASAKPSTDVSRSELKLRIRRIDALQNLVEHQRRGLALIAGAAFVTSRGAFQQWRAQKQQWIAQGETMLRAMARTPGPAIDFRRAAARGQIATDRGWEADLEMATVLVSTGVATLDRYIAQLDDAPDENGAKARPAPESHTIFLVHGSNNEIKSDVARVLEKTADRRYKVTILHEQPNKGQALIEKFEREAKAAACAVVILSADDTGGQKTAKASSKLKSRARQNVVFELGYFYGYLGRRNVVALYERGVELPSDMQGIAYIEVSKDGGWRADLVKELRDAGLELDANKI